MDLDDEHVSAASAPSVRGDGVFALESSRLLCHAQRELRLCSQTAERYACNYHSWSHRIWVMQHCFRFSLEVKLVCLSITVFFHYCVTHLQRKVTFYSTKCVIRGNWNGLTGNEKWLAGNQKGLAGNCFLDSLYSVSPNWTFQPMKNSPWNVLQIVNTSFSHSETSPAYEASKHPDSERSVDIQPATALLHLPLTVLLYDIWHSPHLS